MRTMRLALPIPRRDAFHTVFDAGRLCVGKYVANDSLFINIATLLWASKIERKKDPSGQLLPLDGFVDHGIVV